MFSGPVRIRLPPTVPTVAGAGFVSGPRRCSYFVGKTEDQKTLIVQGSLLPWKGFCTSSLLKSKRETAIVSVVPMSKKSSYNLLLSKKERNRCGRYFKNIYPSLIKFKFSGPSWSTTKKILSVYLYIPNIVGYVRVLLNCIAFSCCYFNKKLFISVYLISFILDGIDGWLARKFNQVSTFGAVLDMVTDRVSTACLLVVLSQFYRPGVIFLSLLALDIASHWLQMYSTFLSGKASHKDVMESSNWLFKLYYGNRFFMAYCCVATEVLYIILYFMGKSYSDSVVSVVEMMMIIMKEQSLISIITALSLFGWGIKQTINLIQMKTAADICVAYDMMKKD